MSDNYLAPEKAIERENGSIKDREIITLKKNFSGDIILNGEEAYKELSEKIIKKGNPAIVLKPKNVNDVKEAVKYAKRTGLLLSIHSGGHGLPGFCTNEGGIVIDLSAINEVSVKDKENNIVRLGAGAKWGEVALNLQQYNLAISSGDTRSVGVGGLVLGGGIGWMVRKYGLTIDSLVGAEVVTAEGKILYISEKEHSDLFWAIRGGGCTFCVVVHYDILARPLKKIYAGTLQYGVENISLLLKQYRNYMRTAPEDITSSIRIMPPMFGGPAVAILQFVYAGTGDDAVKSAAPMLQFEGLINSDIKEMDYPEFLEEPMMPPPTIKFIFNNIYTENLSDEIIESIAAASGKEGNPVFQIRSVNGVMNRINPADTAYSYRNAEALITSALIVPVELKEETVKELLKPWNRIAALGKGSFYSFSNNVDLKEVFPEPAYTRLAEVKRKYDPDNVFNRNFIFN